LQATCFEEPGSSEFASAKADREENRSNCADRAKPAFFMPAEKPPKLLILRPIHQPD
jgi:hypothetical protein